LAALSMFDAPFPWGPWTTVDYRTDFGNQSGCGSNCTGTRPQVSFQISQRWISSDGLTVWPAFSGTGAWDSLNFENGTLGRGGGTKPATIKGLSITTGKPALLDRLSTTYPGSKLYIDRAYVYTTIPAAYSGLESIKLPNDDKSQTASNYLTFT